MKALVKGVTIDLLDPRLKDGFDEDLLASMLAENRPRPTLTFNGRRVETVLDDAATVAPILNGIATDLTEGDFTEAERVHYSPKLRSIIAEERYKNHLVCIQYQAGPGSTVNAVRLTQAAFDAAAKDEFIVDLKKVLIWG